MKCKKPKNKLKILRCIKNNAGLQVGEVKAFIAGIWERYGDNMMMCALDPDYGHGICWYMPMKRVQQRLNRFADECLAEGWWYDTQEFCIGSTFQYLATKIKLIKKSKRSPFRWIKVSYVKKDLAESER